MRFLIRLFLLLVLLVAGALGGLLIASESGEVVVISTESNDGPATTRIWVIDHKDAQWLRGSPSSGWVRRISENPTLEMKRQGISAKYTAMFVPEEISAINTLTDEKYGWANLYVSTIFPVADGVAIRLDPVEQE